MAIPTYTEDDLLAVRQAIRDVIAGGVSNVSVGGQSVTGLSLKELREMEVVILAELSPQPIRTQKIAPYYP